MRSRERGRVAATEFLLNLGAKMDVPRTGSHWQLSSPTDARVYLIDTVSVTTSTSSCTCSTPLVSPVTGKPFCSIASTTRLHRHQPG